MAYNWVRKSIERNIYLERSDDGAERYYVRIRMPGGKPPYARRFGTVADARIARDVVLEAKKDMPELKRGPKFAHEKTVKRVRRRKSFEERYPRRAKLIAFAQQFAHLPPTRAHK